MGSSSGDSVTQLSKVVCLRGVSLTVDVGQTTFAYVITVSRTSRLFPLLYYVHPVPALVSSPRRLLSSFPFPLPRHETPRYHLYHVERSCVPLFCLVFYPFRLSKLSSNPDPLFRDLPLSSSSTCLLSPMSCLQTHSGYGGRIPSGRNPPTPLSSGTWVYRTTTHVFWCVTSWSVGREVLPVCVHS